MNAAATRSALLPAYPRQDLLLVSGEGARVRDIEGREYIDLLAGIAVVGLGHRHPAPLAAAREQLDRLWHVSNLYRTEPQEALAIRLSERFGGAQAFFCNSGAEAIEAGLKYARKATGRSGVVALEGSFHGRTLGALSVTGQPGKREAFAPLLAGVRFAPPNDRDALAAAVGTDTGCIVLEPILGEGGVRPLTSDFLAAARELADATEALLLFDEVQTGVGRSGRFFAWERHGVKPDAVTLAKGLANGLPIGCLLVADHAAGAFEPGDHASTFGGNPIACAAACAVCDTIDEQLLAHVEAAGELIRERLEPLVREVRGAGLLLGAELDRSAAEVLDACRERGVLVGAAGERVLRLTPPLTIPSADLEQALSVLQEVLA